MVDGMPAPPTPLLEHEKSKPVSKGTPGVRQSFSCAECKRLKLKCSREWPCTSCVKRGCAQICPNGEMRTSKGKRLILADTEELHQRIALLEAALAQSHSSQSSTPHPLLADSYVFNHSNRPTPNPKLVGEQTDDVVESTFGTLTIGDAGEARFVGSFAGSEYLRDGEESSRDGTTNGRLPTPPPTGVNGHQVPMQAQVQQTATYAEGGLALQDSFIAGGVGSVYDLEALRAELPDWETEGQRLCESYWDNVSWMYQTIPRPMFEADHLPHAYDTEAAPQAHKLACVYLIMAVGVMFDLHRPPFDPRGERLFLLGRACLSAVGLEHSSPATVQALLLCGTYILNDKHGNGAEIFWPMLGTAVKIAQSLGLHRDGSAFGLSDYEIAERRQVWWEVVTYDRLQALCFGRPCATNSRTADTRMPQGPSDLFNDDDGFHYAKYRMIQMMERVIDVQTQTAAVPYTAIAALDKELYEFKNSLPDSLLPAKTIQELPLDPSIPPHVVIHRLGIRLQVAQTRLLLNRPSFARALKDRPEDPSRSKVGPSFLALYESAQEIVQLVKTLVIYHPSLIARWWFFWFHAFSSAVCLSAICIRAPSSAFAAPAFTALSIVRDISHAARPGCRAKRGLPILTRLRKRALAALKAANEAARSNPKHKKPEKPDEEDDLSHLVGSAKLRRLGSGNGKAGSSSPPSRQTGGVPLPLMTPVHSQIHDSGVPPPTAVSNGRSPTETASTSTTLADPVQGMVPPFPQDPAQYLNMPDHIQPNLSISPPTGVNSWLGDFSPQWSDQSILYPSSADLVSPTTNNLATSYGAATEMSYFPSFNSAPIGTGGGGIVPGQEMGSLSYDLSGGMDMDMSMALGLDRDTSGAIGDQAGEWDLDFDALEFINVGNMGNTY